MPTQQKTSPQRGKHIRPVSPERRSVGLALWGAAFLVFLSIPLGKVPVISLIPAILKGLLGLGYYFIPVSFLAGRYLLLSHPGTLGTMQAAAGCLLPVSLGSLHHTIFCAAKLSDGLSLWETGTVLESGGVISGGLAQILISILGNTATAVLLGIVLAALLSTAFLTGTFEPSHRKRAETYDSTEIPESSFYDSEYDPEADIHSYHKSRSAPSISEYNIPMDEDTGSEAFLSESEEAVLRSLFNSDAAQTPADLFLQMLAASAQTPSDGSSGSYDAPPVSAPTEQPPAAPVKPVKPAAKYPAGWKPVVWTSTPRSEPAWAIPVSKPHKAEPAKPKKTGGKLPETAAKNPNKLEKTELSFVLIGYQKPRKVRRTVKKQTSARKFPPALPPMPKILSLPEHSAISSVKQFPLHTSLLPSVFLQTPNIFLFPALAVKASTWFILIDYIPSAKQVYRRNHFKPDNIAYLNNRLPAPALLPPIPSPSPSRFPRTPDRLLLPAPKNTPVFSSTATESDMPTSFMLGKIDYNPPQKRGYTLHDSKSEHICSHKSLPSSAPVLLLPPAPSYPMFPRTPDRLLLPAPKNIPVFDSAALIENMKKAALFPKSALPPALNIRIAPDTGTENAAIHVHSEDKALPSLDLFNAPPDSEAFEDTVDFRSNAEHLCDVLKSFGVKVTCGDVVRGPAITQYEFTLERGVKLAKITNLADDIALSLGASGVRIAPIPGKISVVGIEVPNKHIAPVYIREVLASPEFKEHPSPVAFAIGKDIGNRSVIGDIASLPHILIAGTTGSGKSVCTNSLISSILYKASPSDAKFIMIDPKMVELAPYNGIPHLLVPVVTDPKKAAGALQWAVYEMMKRYKHFSELGVKKLSEYNALAEANTEIEHMPTIVIVIDELADLMLAAAKEVEESICRVAQMGRAAGMHLVIATQRPSSDVITGLMKANIPSRIAFAVASSLESRIILDSSGAEKLVGRGDMLYAPLGASKPQRVQGCYITPEEIEKVVNYVKSTGKVQYSEEIMKKIEESVKDKESKAEAANIDPSNVPDSEEEQLLKNAVEIFLDCGQASVSMLQRRLKLGYSRAARLVDEMEERGYVGAFEGSKPRKILISREEWAEICSDLAVEDVEKEYL